jgi:hypothetical protein
LLLFFKKEVPFFYSFLKKRTKKLQHIGANSLILNALGAELLDMESLSIGTSFTETAGFVALQAGSITGGKMSIASGAFLSSAGESSMSATRTLIFDTTLLALAPLCNALAECCGAGERQKRPSFRSDLLRQRLRRRYRQQASGGKYSLRRQGQKALAQCGFCRI